jgi:hypothetical protein
LQIDPLDVEQSYTAAAHRRFHRHGAHQIGLSGELLFGDPARPDGVVRGDQAVQLRRDVLLVELGVRQVEIQPPLGVADLAAGDVAGDHGTEQVQTAVHAHVTVTALPVDLQSHLGAGSGRGGAFFKDMHDVLVGLPLDRIDDAQPGAVFQD